MTIKEAMAAIGGTFALGVPGQKGYDSYKRQFMKNVWIKYWKMVKDKDKRLRKKKIMT